MTIQPQRAWDIRVMDQESRVERAMKKAALLMAIGANGFHGRYVQSRVESESVFVIDIAIRLSHVMAA